MEVLSSEVIKQRIPIRGDKFAPLYAYKALLKIAISLLPVSELPEYKEMIECLHSADEPPANGRLLVGFSYAYVGNAPPTLAGVLYRLRNDRAAESVIIALFQTGSV